MPAPTIYVIAGCNGAGKTTFAKEFLPHEVKCLRFYNADEVARGLSATNWNSITSGSPTSNKQSRVCVAESEWEAIMFQFRTFAVGSSAA
jgi:predicted ABC-type ATPase